MLRRSRCGLQPSRIRILLQFIQGDLHVRHGLPAALWILRRQRLINFSRSTGIVGVMPLTGFGSWCRIAERVDSLLVP